MERDVNGLEVLTRSECLWLLGTRSLGRIAVTSQALPVILPVNYVVVDDDIVLRTRSGTRLDVATRQAIVAFEVDDIDDETGVGWSVMAQGEAREITDPRVLEVARAAPLAPWLDPFLQRHVAISLDLVSGRRITSDLAVSAPASRPSPP